MPERSRRSMKISPPWSRRLCTQPETRAGAPARSAERSPAPRVAVRVGARRALHRRPRSRRIRATTSPACTSFCSPACMSFRTVLSSLDHRNVASAEPVGLLELALARPSGELDLRVQARAARLVDDREGGRAPARRVARDVQVDRRRRRRQPGPASSIRSIPAAQPQPGVAGPPSSRRARRSARRRPRRSGRRARRT